jgi:phosphate uptake regulator
VSGNSRRTLLPLDALSIDDYFERRGNIMAMMISQVYDAFIASGAPENKAREAAEAMAAYDGRFNKIENDLGTILGDINLLKWMNGITWALSFGILFKLFLH